MDCLQKILFIIPLILNSCATSQVEEEFLQQEEQTAIGFNGKVHNSRAIVTLPEIQNDDKRFSSMGRL